MTPAKTYAQSIPGSADAGRVERNLPRPPVQHENQAIAIPNTAPQTAAPAGAETVNMVLKGVRIEGATAFSDAELSPLYSEFIGKDVTLATVYSIADRITKYYRDKGYFLSLAYIPDQKIDNTGVVKINVIEGHIGVVDMGENIEFGQYNLLHEYSTRLTKLKPVRADQIESFLLRINDLPGINFRAVLSPIQGEAPGTAKLSLIKQDKPGSGYISTDNYGSRFLGPEEAFISYSTSFLPLQQTTFSLLKSLPPDELQYVSLDHSIAIAPNMFLKFDGSTTHTSPGYTLRDFDIDSRSTSMGVALSYQWIRQRTEDLSTDIGFDGRNTTSDILGTALTRDYIRAIRASVSYDKLDGFKGFNVGKITLSRGIDGFGSSKKDDINLSREEAEPDFTKAEFTVSRLQAISNDWSVFVSSAGQWSSKPLYSSEEFGYGGQSFGRAFDSSEITGDQGLAASVEVRYDGLEFSDNFKIQPYVFYDIGVVWNQDEGQPKRQSGASMGPGIHFSTYWGISGAIEAAFPLTREIENPIYEGNANAPRLSARLSKAF